MTGQPTLAKNDLRSLDWLRKLLRVFRTRHARTSKGALRHLQRNYELSEPTQLRHILVRSPEMKDLHLILVTHSNRAGDEVRSYGPLRIKDVVDAFGEIDADPILDEPVVNRRERLWPEARPKRATLREAVLPHFQSIYHNLRVDVFNGLEHGTFLHPGAIAENAAIWSYHGDLFAEDPARLIEDFFEQAEDNEQRVREHRKIRRLQPPPAPPPYEPQKWDGHYGYLYPPVLVGELPKLNFRERFFGGYVWGPGRIVATGRIGTIEFFAARNGCIGVHVPQSANALKALNAFVLALNRQGIESHHLRRKDLAGFSMRTDQPTGQRTFSSYGFPENHVEGQEHAENPGFLVRRTHISEKIIRRAAAAAARLLRRADVDDRLSLVSAQTHIYEEAYQEAFFVAWTVVEERLLVHWETFLTGLAVKRLKREVRTGEWSVPAVARALLLADQLEEALVNRIVDFNTKRNRILHGTEHATKSDANGLLETAERLLDAIAKRPRALSGRRRH